MLKIMKAKNMYGFKYIQVFKDDIDKDKQLLDISLG
jgi:hypothetical protein